MAEIRIVETGTIRPDELFVLYQEMGWLKGSEVGEGGIEQMMGVCTAIIEARNGEGELVGMAKVLSDGLFHTTVAEVVVHPDRQRRSIGRQLLSAVQAMFGHTPIFIDCMSESAGFFEKCGYSARPNMRVVSCIFSLKTGPISPNTDTPFHTHGTT